MDRNVVILKKKIKGITVCRSVFHVVKIFGWRTFFYVIISVASRLFCVFVDRLSLNRFVFILKVFFLEKVLDDILIFVQNIG